MQCDYPFPRVVLFDWDNTLMDTTPVLFKAFCAMRRHYDLPEYSMEEYQAKTGLSLRETFPDLFGDKWEEAKKVYLDAYRENHLTLLTPFEKRASWWLSFMTKSGAPASSAIKRGLFYRKKSIIWAGRIIFMPSSARGTRQRTSLRRIRCLKRWKERESFMKTGGCPTPSGLSATAMPICNAPPRPAVCPCGWPLSIKTATG